jgi:hypothetical protein
MALLKISQSQQRSVILKHMVTVSLHRRDAAMDILTEHYPDYEHKFVYDNAPSHLKRPEGSVTTRNMPKNTPKPGTNWGVEVSKRDAVGNLEYNTDG